MPLERNLLALNHGYALLRCLCAEVAAVEVIEIALGCGGCHRSGDGRRSLLRYANDLGCEVHAYGVGAGRALERPCTGFAQSPSV